MNLARRGGVKRREFITLLGGAAAGLPLVARARQTAKVHRIGLLSPASQGLGTGAFRDGLRALGYLEGHNIIIEHRSADGRYERLPDLAAELARLRVDVIGARS
jgi:putative tryptophan/tyrosine transport system substrate-binding protein